MNAVKISERQATSVSWPYLILGSTDDCSIVMVMVESNLSTVSGDPNISHSTHTKITGLDLSWDDICSLFEGIYINWSPTLFSNSLVHHGSVCTVCVCSIQINHHLAFGKPRMQRTKVFVSKSKCWLIWVLIFCLHLCTASNRCLRLTADSAVHGPDGEVWVLLTRHQISSDHKSEYIALHVNDHDHGDLNKIADRVRLYVVSAVMCIYSLVS